MILSFSDKKHVIHVFFVCKESIKAKILEIFSLSMLKHGMSKNIINNHILCRKSELNLRKTFECGQCFRWNPLPVTTQTCKLHRHSASENRHASENRPASEDSPTSAEHCPRYDFRDPHLSYVGVIKNTLLVASEAEGDIHISFPEGRSLSDEELKTYFDLFRDYGRIEEGICREADRRNDTFLQDAVRYSHGLRLLCQDPFETLISFIISANNHISKIKMTVEDLCTKFGEPVGELGGCTYYSFPVAERIAGRYAELEKVRAVGYRARAISEAAEKVADGRMELEKIEQGKSGFEEAVRTLRSLYGVGEKVANCVALFGLGHAEGFPVDTWIRKVLKERYGVEKGFEAFVKEHFNSHPGIAQQYLFFYYREMQKKK